MSNFCTKTIFNSFDESGRADWLDFIDDDDITHNQLMVSELGALVREGYIFVASSGGLVNCATIDIDTVLGLLQAKRYGFSELRTKLRLHKYDVKNIKKLHIFLAELLQSGEIECDIENGVNVFKWLGV